MTESHQQDSVRYDETGKAALRKQFLAVRKELRQQARDDANWKIVKHLRLLLTEIRARMGFDSESTPVAGLYCAFRGEVDVAPLAATLRVEDWRTAFPVTHPDDRSMAFYQTDEYTTWQKGAYGILEPEPAAASSVDGPGMAMLVIPGVAFTPSGGRLGYGGGYYDRWFAANASRRGPIRIGAAFHCQLTAELPLSEDDVRMHYVVTENGVIACEHVH